MPPIDIAGRSTANSPVRASQAVLFQHTLEIHIGLRVLSEIVEEFGDVSNCLDDNISQAAACIDGIITDADTKATSDLSEPCRPPFLETCGIRLKLRKQRFLLFNPSEECRNGIPWACLLLFGFPRGPFFKEARFRRQGCYAIGNDCGFQFRWNRTGCRSGRADPLFVLRYQALFEIGRECPPNGFRLFDQSSLFAAGVLDFEDEGFCLLGHDFRGLGCAVCRCRRMISADGIGQYF
ncbi:MULTISPECIES: hypothetical protein [unclassified Rhizobium]|uniref:hypothetical protein n=1 Tax=unclassified Rhizobium TaxID=2613769 RepID=UPI0013AF5C28|nr:MULTISPECIES: hypothetical protein [unclassified Rhizobium]MBB3286883.1 hypothetical protein [Rhizobium sp. BK252]MBB3401623.1 hypothetical protein [Rhizobium sp. BK289]MBB3414433.1 hypothetical protein [Rhizobium sp. BK284]MBB3482321.1 hypothetical protein [Rhizobium sp. BK347]MDK4718379.1 hypothetical protein [Rhizobium sp. CNPSo 3968]